jgi:enamine deaminase RidA (YjgF/YER057c/UK114 family)
VGPDAPLYAGAVALRDTNAVYDGYSAGENPARIVVQVPSWPGLFVVEIDGVAVG